MGAWPTSTACCPHRACTSSTRPSCGCTSTCWACAGAQIADVTDAWPPRPAAQCRALPARTRHHGPRQPRQRRAARDVAERATNPGRARLRTGRRDLRPRRAGPPYRGSRHQHHALPHHVARARHDAARRSRHDDHLRLPGPQHPGRALQGDGRLRDERRQHDQAGKLHGRRLVHRDAVLRRYRGPPRGPQRATGAGGAGVFHPVSGPFGL
jgi:hypothetical protein